MSKCKELNKDKDCKHRLENGICEAYEGKDGLPLMCVGQWAEDKHYFLKRYCDAFTTGFRKKWKLNFIDLFSGPGLSIIKDQEVEVEGSPLIGASYPFERYIFAEEDKESIRILKARTKGLANVNYIPGDANEHIDEIIGMIHTRSLSLIFVDPFNIQLKMSSLKKILKSRHCDLILHFPYGTYLQRVLTQKNLNEETKDAITDFFGNDNWIKLTSNPKPSQLIDLYSKELASIGYKISDNCPSMKNIRQARLYYLIFATKHPTGLKIWKNISMIEPNKQRKLDI